MPAVADPSLDASVRGFHLSDLELSPEWESVAANALSLSRGVAALAVLAMGLIGASAAPLLAVATAMWLTDALDGHVARRAARRGGRKRLDGEILDPLMDDVAFVCGFLVLLAAGVVPLWFVVALLASRVLFALIRMLGLASREEFFAAPTVLTKSSGAVLAVGQLVLLAHMALPASPLFSGEALPVIALATMTTVTTCSVVYFAIVRHGHLLRRLLAP